MIRYGSVCSGIEAAKSCSRCGTTLPISEFHKAPRGKHGRHSWCKHCANAAQKAHRDSTGRLPGKAKWLRKIRYGITEEQYATMLADQDGQCAICGTMPRRMCVDHCHKTGQVRGLLCHRCNIHLSPIEDAAYRTAAMAYLEKYA